MTRPHKILKKIKKAVTTEEKSVSIFNLAQEVHRVANALERQNSLGRRFLVGLILGLSTAIGASLVATLAIFLLRIFILEYFGLDVESI